MDSVSICNMALMAAGIPAIVSFEDNNNNSKMCKAFFPAMRDRVLRDHLWSFATHIMPLQKLADASPDPDYSAMCQLPGDVIRIIRLLDDSPYCRISDKILVKHTPATLVYIRRVEDPNLFDPAFTDALQNLLSSEFAFSASRDLQMAQYFRQEYERKLAVARSIDSQENCHEYQQQGVYSTFAAARMGFAPEKHGKINFVQGTAGIQGN